MVFEKERAGIRRFVCGQLRDEPDLSTLTLGILKRRYLAHVGCESLSPEARNVMKQVVKEELVKMQEKDENGSELETEKPQNKRKRDKENEEVISGKDDDDDDDESRAKKSRRQSTSSSESEDKEECETGSEEEAQIKSGSEDAEQEVKNSKRIKNGNRKPQIKGEDSSNEEVNKSEKNESDCDERPKEMVIKRANATKPGETRSGNISQGKTPQSDEENETDTESKSQKSEKNDNSSDDSEKEEKASVEKKDNDPESDSSSLPSIEDEKNSGKENSQDDKKKKTMKKEQKKEKSDRGQKQGDRAVVRLKQYISLCGLRPNYKKLLDGCRSVRSQVAVLKKELEELGVHGQPSVKKCRIVRMKREETQELAELDVSNIIATKESEDKEECEEEPQIKSEDAEQEVKNSKRIKNGNRKAQINVEDSSDEDVKSGKKGNESDCDDSPKEMVIKRANATKPGETRSSNISQGKTPQSDEENETDTESKSQKSEKNDNSSDDSEKEEKASVEKKDNDPESDSSSLPSIEDEKNSGKENSQDDKKKKTMKKEQKKEKNDRGQKQGDKAVVRLKRYISLCGLRPNYKKLLDGCYSVRSQVAVLKKELEELGVHGQPSVKKCKIVRMKREETQELAELDVSNIIATKGRPKRRAASAWQEKCESPSSTYLHTLNSGSDSNEENNSHRGRRRTDWANLQGIISDDADSN